MFPLTDHASRQPLRRLAATALLTAVLLAAGCVGSAKTRYFLLSPTATPTANAAKPTALAYIRNCQLPDYLDRTEMVMRKSQNEVIFRDFDNWAQMPERMIQRILRENLARIIGAENVAGVKTPQSRSDIIQIDYEFNQLDPTTNGVLQVNVDCWLHALPTKTETIHNLSFTLPLDNESGDAITNAINQALARIAEETAAMLK